MKLEERLAAHLRAAGQQINGPEVSFATVVSRSANRVWRTRALIAAGVLAGLGVLSFGVSQLRTVQVLGSEEEPTRVVVSPYVTLRSRLSSEAETELFAVTADQPSYWRLAALDTYENDIWKVSGDAVDIDGWLPGASSSVGSDTVITQDIEVVALGAIWLPTAPEPFEVTSDVSGLQWDADQRHLSVASSMENSDGVSYRALSGRPDLTADELRAADGQDPEMITEIYLHYLPGLDLSESAILLGHEITAGATTRYDQARALQDYFRDFSYDLEGESQTSGGADKRRQDPIDGLLLNRAGIAPQFASAFAVMARDLGIPSRVAVGFTWGDPVAGDSLEAETESTATYLVTGRHAHAWPEVYFPDIGWVPFEPTPGRGIPGAEAYTGIDASQDSAVQATLD